MEIGPTLPKHLIKKDECDVNEDTFGPALPPGFKTKPKAIIGPCMKPDFDEKLNKEQNISDNEENETEVIGPMLPTIKYNDDEYLKRKRQEIESRASSKKGELNGKEIKKILKREEWMTELPPDLSKNFGLGARTFRTKDIDLGDRSVWTATPLDNPKKKTEETKKATEYSKSKKDYETQHFVEKHNKRFRDKSLIDMHQKERKKKKNEDISEKERKPFDRETDLGISQMDPSKRRSLIKQSKNLNSKFQHSKDGPAYL